MHHAALPHAGSCHLLNLSNVRQYQSRPDRFEIATAADARPRVYRADSSEEAAAWVQAIKAAVAAVRQRAAEGQQDSEQALASLEKISSSGAAEPVQQSARWGGE